MAQEIALHVEHLTRVEGHGDIFFNAKDGKVALSVTLLHR
jgi:hypothetical protein